MDTGPPMTKDQRVADELLRTEKQYVANLNLLDQASHYFIGNILLAIHIA